MSKKLLLIALSVSFLSGCGGEKKEAKELLEMELGENRDVKVHKVFDATKYDFLTLKRNKKYNTDTKLLCGLVTYNQSNGAPIKGKTPFLIKVFSDMDPRFKILSYDTNGGTIYECGKYERSSDTFKIDRCKFKNSLGIFDVKKCLSNGRLTPGAWEHYEE